MSENGNPRVPIQEVAEVKFPPIISNLGTIPTSYKDSMDFYESVSSLYKFLNDTVLPAINDDTEAVEELQELFEELEDYVDTFADEINSKQPMITNANKLPSDLVSTDDQTNKFVTSEEKATWNAKQNALTFDTTPTANSTNPVTSTGIKTYVDTIVGDIESILEELDIGGGV